MNIIKKLKANDIFYMKANKGKKVIIMDKKGYYEKVEEDPYFILNRNPLPNTVRKLSINQTNPFIENHEKTLKYSNHSVFQKSINPTPLWDLLFSILMLHFTT